MLDLSGGHYREALASARRVYEADPLSQGNQALPEMIEAGVRRWRYVYRAIDQYGQTIDVYVSVRRDTRAARRFFVAALGAHDEPTEVVTDRAWTLLAVVDELLPAPFHNTAQYAKNRIEADNERSRSPVFGRHTTAFAAGHFLTKFGICQAVASSRARRTRTRARWRR